MQNITRRISEFLIAWRWPLFAVAVIASIASFWPAGKLGFDRSIENMFTPDDPLLPPYRKLMRTFGGNEVVLAVYVDPQLLDSSGRGIERLKQVSGKLKVDGVRDVFSLAELSDTLSVIERISNPLGIGKKSLQPEVLNPQSEMARRFRELFTGYTHGADGETAALICVLESEAEAKVDRRVTIRELRTIMQSLPGGMLAGEPVMVAEGFQELEIDGERLGVTSTVLLAITILVCFRSLRWVIAPIVVVQAALVLTRALLAVAGLRLSMVSSMLTAIVTVVGVGTMVLLIVGYRDARRTGLKPREALALTGALLAGPVFWSIMADVVGFGSLIISGVSPVRDFGTMSATGSFVVLVAIACMLPVLALTGRFDTDPRKAWGEAALNLGLARMINSVERYPKTVGFLALACAVLAAIGAARLEVETDFTKNFRPGTSIPTSYDYVETHLGGAGVWDVIVPAPATLDEKFLADVRSLEEQLRELVVPAEFPGGGQAGLTKVISLADIDEAAQGNASTATFPLSWRIEGMKRAMPAFSTSLHSKDPVDGKFYFRIMLRSRERQSALEKKWLIDSVTRLCQQSFPATNDAPAAEPTGFFVLLTNIIESVSRDQWTTFALSALGIYLMMVLAFRSPVLAFVALVPNALPIVMVIGLMGWLGLKINMGAAMIAAVSLGLSVRSSIYYITNFRRAQAEGLSVREALAEVQQTVGRATAFTTLALIVGFSVLCMSQFVPTIYFGGLVSLAMLGGMFGNLLVLPLLLQLVTPVARHATPGQSP